MSDEQGPDAPPRPPADADEEPLVRVEDLHMSFGETAVLRGISFGLKRGTTTCILGGSGGGKSTLLKCMIGVHRPTRGRVVIGGDELQPDDEDALERVRSRFGVMFQGGALLNSLSVAENVALPLTERTSLPLEIIDSMVKMRLHQVGLLHAAERYPAELSGGMIKRVAIARALARDPAVIFYDEPSAGLDPIATSRIDLLVRGLTTAPIGMTNIVITHVLESVERIADRIIMLDRGELIFDGSWEEFLASDDDRIERFRSGDIGGADPKGAAHREYYRDLLS